MNEERQEKLLTYILECGYSDLNELDKRINLLELFDGDLFEIVEEVKDEFNDIDFNLLILMIFKEITFKVGEAIKEDEPEIGAKLQEYDNFFLNYMDSWININALDYPEDNKDDIIKEVIAELKEDV